jgi:hypothetical protein
MYSTGRIESIWNIKDIEDLAYFSEALNDTALTHEWQKRYKLNFGIGSQADFRVPQPVWVPNIIDLLEKQNIKLHNVATSFYRLHPGELLPYHVDKYIKYCEYYSVDPSKVYRIIIFLQDWQPGFLFEVENIPIVQYPAGTFVMWNSHTPHMAGNLGFVPRYTLQVTGHLK